jgi:hypothetical protein
MVQISASQSGEEKTVDEIETLFAELGFTSSFWSLR